MARFAMAGSRRVFVDRNARWDVVPLPARTARTSFGAGCRGTPGRGSAHGARRRHFAAARVGLRPPCCDRSAAIRGASER